MKYITVNALTNQTSNSTTEIVEASQVEQVLEEVGKYDATMYWNSIFIVVVPLFSGGFFCILIYVCIINVYKQSKYEKRKAHES